MKDYCILLVLSTLEGSERSSKSGSGINNLCLLTCHVAERTKTVSFNASVCMMGRRRICYPRHSVSSLASRVSHTHNRFTALFPGPPGWAGARRELLDFVVHGKINRGRYTDHPAGHHSIRTNQCLPPLSRHFLQAGCPSCCPTTSVKDWRQWLIKHVDLKYW